MRSYKVMCKSYEIAECLGLLALLIKTEDWSEIQGDRPFEERLSAAIKKLRSLSEFYIATGNYMLIDETIQSTHDFIESLKGLSDVDFIYYGLSETLDRPLVEKAMSDITVIDGIEEYYKGLRQEATTMIQKHPEIRKAFIVALEIICTWLKDSEEERQVKYYEFQQVIKHELSQSAPLDVAQGLMGKTFKRISDYENYIFIPVCHAPFKCVRYFDHKTLIVFKNLNEVKSEMSASQLAQFMKVLSDPTRLEILHAISRKPSFGIELSERFGVSRPTVSHHLDQLNSIGLVHIEREKNTKYYSLNRIRYKEIIDALNNWFA